MTVPKPRAQRCPECRDETAPEFRPFCSKRCADVALARWRTGGYASPSAGEPGDDAGDDSPPGPAGPH